MKAVCLSWDGLKRVFQINEFVIISNNIAHECDSGVFWLVSSYEACITGKMSYIVLSISPKENERIHNEAEIVIVEWDRDSSWDGIALVIDFLPQESFTFRGLALVWDCSL